MKPTEIIAIDWHVYRKFLLVWAAVLALGIFAAMLLPPGAQVAKGIFLGATRVCPYGFAHFCFVIPRGFGLLKRIGSGKKVGHSDGGKGATESVSVWSKATRL